MASEHKKDTSHEAVKSGEEIRFAVGESSLGLILVASSAKGLVSILLESTSALSPHGARMLFSIAG
jgi:hypothetical protein